MVAITRASSGADRDAVRGGHRHNSPVTSAFRRRLGDGRSCEYGHSTAGWSSRWSSRAAQSGTAGVQQITQSMRLAPATSETTYRSDGVDIDVKIDVNVDVNKSRSGARFLDRAPVTARAMGVIRVQHRNRED
jgi:hypothetical protein